jgi:hypothetical protein
MADQNAIAKILSANDVGDTGSHQAGMHVPRRNEILSFFPSLDANIKNPRVRLTFVDETGRSWQFSFIHYNNRWFGGTRNEFRLTHMTEFITRNRLAVGDAVILRRNAKGELFIGVARGRQATNLGRRNPLRLGSRWIVIPTK